MLNRSVIDRKALCRRDMRRARAAFVRQRADPRMPVPAGWDMLLGGLPTLASYCAAGAEADSGELAAIAAARGIRVVYPRIGLDDVMDFAGDERGWSNGPHGIRQPAPDAPSADPALILVPLLGFDRCGGRLGQGGGYYDRALARHRTARRIGVAWSVQELVAVPREPHDIPLHAVITEKEWITIDAA